MKKVTKASFKMMNMESQSIIVRCKWTKVELESKVGSKWTRQCYTNPSTDSKYDNCKQEVYKIKDLKMNKPSRCTSYVLVYKQEQTRKVMKASLKGNLNMTWMSLYMSVYIFFHILLGWHYGEVIETDVQI